jgi:ATP-dependent DNA helicase RecG
LGENDEIHGYLFEQVEKTMDLLLTKYLQASIGYQGLHRIEKFPFPEVALRETLLNAIAHKDYSSGVPIQISVYADKIIFWNDGTLPENWTVEELKKKHASRPFNPDISTAFFRAGLIEAWGRGTVRIIAECLNYGIPAPIFNYDFASFSIEFQPEKLETIPEELPKKPEVFLTDNQKRIIELMRENESITHLKLSEKLGVSAKSIHFLLKKLKENGIIERLGADKNGKWRVLR